MYYYRLGKKILKKFQQKLFFLSGRTTRKIIFLRLFPQDKPLSFFIFHTEAGFIVSNTRTFILKMNIICISISRGIAHIDISEFSDTFYLPKPWVWVLYSILSSLIPVLFPRTERGKCLTKGRKHINMNTKEIKSMSGRKRLFSVFIV